MKAIIGKEIITMNEKREKIKNGIILIDENGKISFVGKKEEVQIPDNTEILEAPESIITPGLVDAHSHLGIIPEELDWEYSDVNDYYSPVTAHLKAIDAIDPFDEGFKEALEGGVTTVYTGPGSANVIGGIGTIIKTYGKSLTEMVVDPEAALKMALGPKRQQEYKSKTPYPTSRMGTVALLRTWLLKAKRYSEGKIDGEKLDEEERIILQVIAKVLSGKMIAKIHLSTSPDEILSILRIIDEFKFYATIDHVFGGQLLLDEILKRKVPVVYGPPMLSKVAAYFKYMADDAPVMMYRKGVSVSLMTDHPVIPEKHLRLLAAVTVKNGLTLDEALELVTINPAKALRIEKQVGSIEVGKDADIVIASGHPIKPKTRIEKVLVMGKLAYSSE